MQYASRYPATFNVLLAVLGSSSSSSSCWFNSSCQTQ